MAIERVPYPNALPTVVGDYAAQNDLIYAAFLYAQHPVPVVAGNIVKGAVFNIGGTVYQATADTAIAGGASAYVKITPAGAAATAAYVANLAGVAWNDTYAGYYDGAGNLYLFDEAKAILAGALAVPYRRRFVEHDENGSVSLGDLDVDGALHADGAIDSDATIHADGNIDSDAAIHADGAIDSDTTIHADGAIDSDTTILADGVITAGGGLVAGAGNITLLTKKVDIGDWNMDTTVSIQVSHGVTAAKIKSVEAYIWGDTGLFAGNLLRSGYVMIYPPDTTKLELDRTAAGVFDAVGFSSVPYNRGCIIIRYIP